MLRIFSSKYVYSALFNNISEIVDWLITRNTVEVIALNESIFITKDKYGNEMTFGIASEVGYFTGSVMSPISYFVVNLFNRRARHVSRSLCESSSR